MKHEGFPRRFPHPSWAWPTGGLDTLLVAAAASDHARALAAARDWFCHNDIDDADFRENRLILAISSRFGKDLADLPEYRRLVGLQRMLWTKSRMAIREALPAFHELSSCGIRTMLIKGAARIALRPEDQKFRVSHDTDILVQRGDAAQALDILCRFGWVASSGDSGMCLRARLPQLRSINMFYGHFGDIDLHLQGFRTPAYEAALEQQVWVTAQKKMFFDVPVLIPTPEYWLALALDSSALDAHSHSDWLVDCAVLLSTQTVDPELLLSILKRRDLTIQAEIAFSYLEQRLGCAIPVLPEISAHNSSLGHGARYSVLLQSKPRTDWTPPQKIARGIAKQLRLFKAHRETAAANGGGPRLLRGRIQRIPGESRVGAAPSGRAPLSCPATDSVAFKLALAVKFNGMRRRYDFEINSDLGHLCRLRVRDVIGRKGMHKLVFRGELPLDTSLSDLWVEARPGKTVRSQDKVEQEQYSAPDFTLLQFKTTPAFCSAADDTSHL